MDNLELMIENYDYHRQAFTKQRIVVIIILNHQF